MSVNQITIYASAHSKQKLRPTRIREKVMSSFDEHRMNGMNATGRPVTPKEKDNIMWDLYKDRGDESTTFGWLRNIEERCEIICQELVNAGYVKYINKEPLGSSHTTVHITQEGERFCETTSFSDSDQPLVRK